MPTTEAEPPIVLKPEINVADPPHSVASVGATSVGALASAELQEVELNELFGNYHGPLPRDHVQWLRETGSEDKFAKYIEDTYNISKGVGTQQEYPGVYQMSDALSELYKQLARESRKARPNRVLMMEIRKELVRILREQKTKDIVHEQGVKKYQQERSNAVAMQGRTKRFSTISDPIRGDIFAHNKTTKAYQDVNRKVLSHLKQLAAHKDTSLLFDNKLSPKMDFEEGEMSETGLFAERGILGKARNKKPENFRVNKLAQNQKAIEAKLQYQMHLGFKAREAARLYRTKSQEYANTAKEAEKIKQELAEIMRQSTALRTQGESTTALDEAQKKGNTALDIANAKLVDLGKYSWTEIQDHPEEYKRKFPGLIKAETKSRMSRKHFLAHAEEIGKAYANVQQLWGDHPPINPLSKAGFWRAPTKSYKGKLEPDTIQRALSRNNDIERAEKLRDIMMLFGRYGHEDPQSKQHPPVYMFKSRVPLQMSESTKTLGAAAKGEKFMVYPQFMPDQKKFVARLSNIAATASNLPPQVREDMARWNMTSKDLSSYAYALGVTIPREKDDEKPLADHPEFADFIKTLQIGKKGDHGFYPKPNVYKTMTRRDLSMYNALMKRTHVYHKLGINHQDINAFIEGQHQKYLSYNAVLSREHHKQITQRKFAQVKPTREIMDRLTGDTTSLLTSIAEKQSDPIVGVRLFSPNGVKGAPIQHSKEIKQIQSLKQSRHDWRPLILGDHFSHVSWDGAHLSELEQELDDVEKGLEGSGVGLLGSPQGRKQRYQYIGHLLNQSRYGTLDENESRRMEEVKRAINNHNIYHTNADKQKNDVFLNKTGQYVTLKQTLRNRGWRKGETFRAGVDMDALSRAELFRRKVTVPEEKAEEPPPRQTTPQVPPTPLAFHAPSPAGRGQPMAAGRGAATPTTSPAAISSVPQLLSPGISLTSPGTRMLPTRTSGPRAPAIRPPATRPPAIRGTARGYGPMRGPRQPNLQLAQNFHHIPDIMHAALRTSVSAQAIEAPAYRRDEANVTDLFHRFGNLAAQPTHVGRVHIVTPMMHVPGHILHEALESVNMGRQTAKNAHRRTGPFAGRKGRTKIMSQSANVKNRSRGKIFETTIKRNISDYELHRLFRKIKLHNESAVGSVVFLVYAGSRKLIGDLHSLDIAALKKEIRKRLKDHSAIGLEILDAKGGGALHNPLLHTAEFHLSLL